MSNKIVKRATYIFLISNLLITGQPVYAQVTETLCHLKDKACSTTGAVVGLGLWCCGVTYWCLKLQKYQQKLEEQVKIEQQKRRTLKKELGHVNELLQSHSNLFLESEKRFLDLNKKVEPIELAFYGSNPDDTKKALRLSVLSKFMEAQSSVTVQAWGRIETENSSQSLANSGQESPDSFSPMGEDPASSSREGSVSPTLEKKQEIAVAAGALENKPSSCFLM